ncbi:AMP-activated serine/threonine-protein kinase regulatory subunit [Lobulomyces angularis]|nr:AMP-activated serine/threonine-protein kinase regulatory subunit [Lobulomyces angularis]
MVSKIELLKQNDLIPTLKVSIHPMDSLYEASKLLLKHKLHRLPLLDVSPDGQEMLLSVLTQHKILRQIALNVEDCIYLDFTPKSVGIGTYGNIATAELTTPLVDLLNTLVEKRLSSLPILDSKGIVVDVCEKYDILNLARENSYYDLGMPVSECLNRRSYDFEGIHRCHLSNTLGNVMDTIKDKLVHRFVVVDDNDFLLGVISLSDVLTFFTKD